MPTPADHEKRAMRAELRERRQHLTANEREHATIGLTNNLVALVTGLDARSVSCYLSAPNEPDTRPFLNWALANDIRVLFPITREDGLLDWTVGSPDGDVERQDRKSTRLNSSHVKISYAVFCLKKKRPKGT